MDFQEVSTFFMFGENTWELVLESPLLNLMSAFLFWDAQEDFTLEFFLLADVFLVLLVYQEVERPPFELKSYSLMILEYL